MKKQGFYLRIFNLILLLGCTFCCFIQTGKSQNVEQTLALADKHFELGQYDVALGAYHRCVFFSGNSETDSYLFGQTGWCQLNTGKFKDASISFGRASQLAVEKERQTEYLFLKIRSLLQEGQYRSAYAALLGLTESQHSTDLQKTEMYMGAAFFGMGDYKNAELHFQNFLQFADSGKTDSLKMLFKKAGRIKSIHPKMAMVLNMLVPGAGHFYSGQWVSGAASGGLTAGLVFLTIEVAKAYSPAYGISVFGTMILRYYMGGFKKAEYLALKNAGKKREKLFSEILDLLETQPKNLSPGH